MTALSQQYVSLDKVASFFDLMQKGHLTPNTSEGLIAVLGPHSVNINDEQTRLIEKISETIAIQKRFSFFMGAETSGVVRVHDSCGRWVDRDIVLSVFEPEMIDKIVQHMDNQTTNKEKQ